MPRIQSVEDNETTRDMNAENLVEEQLTSSRILVVDDEELNRDLLARRLGRIRYVVASAVELHGPINNSSKPVLTWFCGTS